VIPFDPPALTPPPEIELYSGPKIGDIQILITMPDSLTDWSSFGLGVQLPSITW
jgi:hypothetical protein